VVVRSVSFQRSAEWRGRVETFLLSRDRSGRTLSIDSQGKEGFLRDYELTPKVIRLDPWECTAGAAYHRLFKLALQVSGDGRMSDSMRARYLTRGLAIERPHY
jgi:hypothetical protein